VGFQVPVSNRCSPVMSCYSPSSNSITSKLYLIPRRGRAQRMEMLPALRESSPSTKFLQVQDSTIWWMNTCPWHGGITTLQFHSSRMLGACLHQFHDAIYSQRHAPGSWRSDDTVTTILGHTVCARLKAMTLFSLSRDVLVASA
jgi:hypothetical protein